MEENANAVFRNILARRTVRDYTREGIQESVIKKILKAGDCAPSGGGLKSRKFMTITRRDDIDFIQGCIFSKAIRIHKKRFVNVPVLMIICADVQRCRRIYRRGRLYAIQDATMAGENMTLMAHALGIGSCWIGQFREKKVRDMFRIGDGEEIVGIMAFGLPASLTEDRYLYN